MTEIPRIINDPVWGDIKVSEPVLLDLMDSGEMRRTKGVSQLGLPKELHHLKTFSRYEHMVGAMASVKKVGGELPEQIKALIHDINHTAFSHLPDWINGLEGVDSFQDDTFAKFLRRSSIPTILEKYSFDVEDFVGDSNFPLVEQEAPRLCADRVDYALREILVCGFGSEQLVKKCVNSLVTFGDRMVFDNYAAARYFGWGFLQLWDMDWNSRESLGKHLLFRDVLKDAIDQEVITWDDFKEDDDYVLTEIRSQGSRELVTRLNKIKLPLDINPYIGTIKGRHDPHKFRFVDPEIKIPGGLVKLTEVNTQYKDILQQRREEASQGFVI